MDVFILKYSFIDIFTKLKFTIFTKYLLVKKNIVKDKHQHYRFHSMNILTVII